MYAEYTLRAVLFLAFLVLAVVTLGTPLSPLLLVGAVALVLPWRSL